MCGCNVLIERQNCCLVSHESPAPVHAHRFVFRAVKPRKRDSWPLDGGEHAPANNNWVFDYLNKKYNEEIEVGYSSELLEQVLWDKIPNCVLKGKKHRIAILIMCTELLFRQLLFTFPDWDDTVNGGKQAWPSAWRWIQRRGSYLMDTGQ